MYSYYPFDRKENSSFLLSTFARKFCQFPGTWAIPDMRCRMPVHCFPLMPPLIVSTRYWSQTISTLVGRLKSWRTLEKNTLLKYESTVLPWTVVPGSECISTLPSVIMKCATSSSSTDIELLLLASRIYIYQQI